MQQTENRTKKIEVTLLNPKNTPETMQYWSLSMDSLTRHSIDHSPWIGYSQEPKASFAIGYTRDAILLKYFVSERDPRVTFHTTNDPVYEDSCVEFFIAFDPAGSSNTARSVRSAVAYYNLEFNAIGTCLIGYGPGRAERTPLPVDLIQTIGVYSSLAPAAPANTGASTDWTLTLKIPLTVFMYDNIQTLAGTKARANFYKCGDECQEPHYLSWNNIIAPGPDFHLPGCFGELLFL